MTPVGPSGQANTTFGCCLPLGERRRLPRLDAFEAQSHGPGTPCLRFAESVALPHARLGTGCWPALPDGACFLPAGFHCKVSGCLCHPSSSPRLGLAHSPSIPVHPCSSPADITAGIFPASSLEHSPRQRASIFQPGMNTDERGCKRMIKTGISAFGASLFSGRSTLFTRAIELTNHAYALTTVAMGEPESIIHQISLATSR